MILILILVFVLLLCHPEVSANCVISTSTLWLTKLVPLLYPNFIIIDFLSKNHVVEQISAFLFPIFQKIFHIQYYKSSAVLLLSLICGAPASTKFIKNALENEDIDEKEANALLYSCSCFSLPYTIYILQVFSLNIILYLIVYIFTMIIIFRIYNHKKRKTKPIQKKKEKENYLSLFFSSITKNIDILISILGIMIFFNILLTLFQVDERIYAYFEILNGHNLLLNLQIPKYLLYFILTSSLSFLGMSVHLQILYVYPQMKYKNFFLTKLLQSLFIGSIFLLIGFFH